jgi:hypothetical protein
MFYKQAGLMLARQALYCLSHTPALLALVIIHRGSHTVYAGQSWTVILLPLPPE